MDLKLGNVKEIKFEERIKGIGGTDISAIMGINPYKTPIEVFTNKIGITEGAEPNEYMKWGTKLESLIREEYEEREHAKVVQVQTLQRIDRPWQIGSVDGLVVVKSPEGVFEAKTAGVGQRDKWGDEGTDEVPTMYMFQVLWYMDIVDVEWADIALLMGGNDFRIYRVERDEELVTMMREAGEKFYNEHILTQSPPGPDSSEAYSKYLKDVHPKSVDEFLTPDAETREWVEKLNEHKDQLVLAETRVREAENHIKKAIADKAGLYCDDFKISYKSSKEIKKTDYKGIVTELEVPQTVIAKYTKMTPGRRSFRCSGPMFKKEV